MRKNHKTSTFLFPWKKKKRLIITKIKLPWINMKPLKCSKINNPYKCKYKTACFFFFGILKTIEKKISGFWLIPFKNRQAFF